MAFFFSTLLHPFAYYLRGCAYMFCNRDTYRSAFHNMGNFAEPKKKKKQKFTFLTSWILSCGRTLSELCVR